MHRKAVASQWAKERIGQRGYWSSMMSDRAAQKRPLVGGAGTYEGIRQVTLTLYLVSSIHALFATLLSGYTLYILI